MFLTVDLLNFALWILYIILPILAIYIVYLVLTKAFRYLGFSSLEAAIIVLVSFLFGFPIVLFGINISNIALLSYNGWIISISTGGAVIPIIISLYLISKKNIPIKEMLIGVIAVAIISFFVTSPEPSKGIVAHFPYWLLPPFIACLTSIILLRRSFEKGASLAYISGIFGVLIGADLLHIPKLLSYPPSKLGTSAIIGGAVILDMVFLTGILAVLFYGTIMYRQKVKEGIS